MNGQPELDSPPFPTFSVADLVTSKPLLLASSGKEYARHGLTPQELEAQRADTRRRLNIEFLDQDDLGELDLDKDITADAAVAPESVTTSARASPDVTVKSESDDTLVKMEIDEPSSAPSPLTPASATPPATSAPAPVPVPVPVSVPVPTPVLEPAPKPRGRKPKNAAPPPPPKEESPGADSDTGVGLSARERNRLKRKRKAGNSAFVAAPPPPPQGAKYNTAPAGQSSNKVRLVEKPEPNGGPSPVPATQPSRHDAEVVVVDPSKGGAVDPKDSASSKNLGQTLLPRQPDTWIWDGVFRALEVDLFSPAWEIRHGAALALREIVKVCGAYGGTRSLATATENGHAHEKWCNDFAAKLLCVFVLDRFGDFVGDQVVAPVRETVSQTLAALLLHAPPATTLHVHRILLEMIQQDFPMPPSAGGRSHIWEVRHAGLLGVKYEVAVRNDLVAENPEILRDVVQAALLGLKSSDDDVRSVAANCLLPVAANIVERLPDELSRILVVLWECLGGLTDDLSSSVGAVMDLLGEHGLNCSRVHIADFFQGHW